MSTKKATEEVKATIEPVETETGALDKFFEHTKEKVNPIVIVDKDSNKKYTLEFSRNSIVALESERGFSMDTIDDFPLFTRNEMLFEYSFRKNHPEITHEDAMRMLDEVLGGLTPAVVRRLMDLYLSGVASHVIVSEEAMAKNARVEIIL